MPLLASRCAVDRWTDASSVQKKTSQLSRTKIVHLADVWWG